MESAFMLIARGTFLHGHGVHRVAQIHEDDGYVVASSLSLSAFF